MGENGSTPIFVTTESIEPQGGNIFKIVFKGDGKLPPAAGRKNVAHITNGCYNPNDQFIGNW